MTFRYRIEQRHRCYSCDEELKSNRNYYEHKEYENNVIHDLIENGFDFVTDINVSVAYEYFEIMVDTNRKLTEEELRNLLEYFKPAVYTNSWEY